MTTSQGHKEASCFYTVTLKVGVHVILQKAYLT